MADETWLEFIKNGSITCYFIIVGVTLVDGGKNKKYEYMSGLYEYSKVLYFINSSGNHQEIDHLLYAIRDEGRRIDDVHWGDERLLSWNISKSGYRTSFFAEGGMNKWENEGPSKCTLLICGGFGGDEELWLADITLL